MRKQEEPWRRRLRLPAYQIAEAARYAKVATATVAAWHKADARKAQTLSSREPRDELSYYQLIEVAVVAAFRNCGVSLQEIREARSYMAHSFKQEFPFAVHRFKTDGKTLWLDYKKIEGPKGKGKLLSVSKRGGRGQFAWDEIIGRRLNEFEYENDGIVVRWRVAGDSSPVVIDPKYSFGTPTVEGVATWVIGGRWKGGESMNDIAEDFGLRADDVLKALEFEGIVPDLDRERKWTN